MIDLVNVVIVWYVRFIVKDVLVLIYPLRRLSCQNLTSFRKKSKIYSGLLNDWFSLVLCDAKLINKSRYLKIS